LPLPYILLFSVAVGDVVVFVPALALRRRKGLFDAFRFSPREILDLLDSGRDDCSTDSGWCVRLRSLQASRFVVLDDCLVSVIFGRKPKSEQGQGERRARTEWG
jgi:hypothetical protein